MWLYTAWHSSLMPFCKSLLTHCLKLKVLHHDCQTLQCLPCQSQAHIANKLYCSARQKQCKRSLNTCFLEPCSWSIWSYSFPMAEQAVWQTSKSKLYGYKYLYTNLACMLSEKERFGSDLAYNVCHVFEIRLPQLVLTSQANDGEWCQNELWSKSPGKAEPLNIQVESVCREHLTERSLPLHSHILPPSLLTYSLLEKDGCTKQTFCHSLEWHPEAVSWSWILLWKAGAATLCFSRGFFVSCCLAGAQFTISTFHCSLGHPWAWQEWGFQRMGVKVGSNNKILNLDKVHKPDERTVSSCVWFCSTSKSTILKKEEKECHLLFITSDKHKVIL